MQRHQNKEDTVDTRWMEGWKGGGTKNKEETSREAANNDERQRGSNE